MAAKVLVIDDDPAIRLLVERGLTPHGFEVQAVQSAEEGLRLVRQWHPDVALIDVYLTETNGLELFRQFRSLDMKLPIIFITADTSSETTIEAMRLGAFDYLSKPLRLDQLRELTASATESRRLMDQPVAMSLTDRFERGERFIGRSTEMVNVFKAIGRVAEQNVIVLIRGESGCGKELVARAIVQHSPRCDQPMVAVNCAAIPDQLLESELFGVEKGAYTGAAHRREGKFEYADGGTLFLDEVGDMSLVVQGKVLRVIQEQKFQRLGSNKDVSTDVRIIAATHRNLEELVARGEFREDLFYRLNGYTIDLPPLRERTEDIPLLLEYFLNRARSEMKKKAVEGLSPDALQALVRYHWPGNIRQLQSVVRQAMLCTTGTVVGIESLPEFIICESHAATPLGYVRGLESDAADRESDSPEDQVYGIHSDSTDDEPGGSHATDGGEFVASLDSIQGLSDFIDQRMREGSTNLYAEMIDEIERFLFRRVLEATGGNQSRAAAILGITRGKVRDRVGKLLSTK